MKYDIRKLTEDLEKIRDTHDLKENEVVCLKLADDTPELFGESIFYLIDFLHNIEEDYNYIEFILSPTTEDTLAVHIYSNDNDTPDIIEDIAEREESQL